MPSVDEWKFVSGANCGPCTLVSVCGATSINWVLGWGRCWSRGARGWVIAMTQSHLDWHEGWSHNFLGFLDVLNIPPLRMTHFLNLFICVFIYFHLFPHLYCIALYCIALHCIILQCIVLYYTTLHYTTLHYTTLHYTTLHYTTLHYTTLHYTTLHYTTLHYTTLHYTALHCTVLHCTVMFCIALYFITYSCKAILI